ncbi:hypothetical protein K9N68_38820 (plasmid) [Kovacikia minuta CCNUW1]|nr:hypothetical protein [Kovacikia minuta]UBF30131.1 hypothetical protein K9N68_38820 [Kovacikia minuta CCNUW1]
MHHPLLALTQTATPEAAVALQQELRSRVVMEDDDLCPCASGRSFQAMLP